MLLSLRHKLQRLLLVRADAEHLLRLYGTSARAAAERLRREENEPDSDAHWTAVLQRLPRR